MTTHINRRKIAVRSALAVALAAVVATPLLADLGVTGAPKKADAAVSLVDASRQITAVSRATNTLDAFWVTPDFKIMTAGFASGRWSAPQHITGGEGHPSGGRFGGPSVFAVARGASRLDAFSVSRTRNVQTAFWNGSSWNGWHQLGTVRVAPNTSVHAVAPNNDTMHLFAVGEDSVIYHNKWTSAADWSGWNPLSGLTAAPNMTAYAVVTGTNTVQVVATTRISVPFFPCGGFPPVCDSKQVHYHVPYVKRYSGTSWSSWQLVGTGFDIKANTNLFPVFTGGGVVFSGINHRSQTFSVSWNSVEGFINDQPVGTGGVVMNDAQVFAAVRSPGAHSQVMTAVPGTDADIWVRPGAGAWEEIPNSRQAAGEPFIMSAGADRFNVFMWRGSDSGVVSAGWTPTNGWTSWTRIDD